LSANAITRHDCRAAEKYANEALEVGEKKFVSTLLKTDALLERGNLWDARNLMHDVASISHFDFLIRNVKLNDQSGDLDAAIKDMEAALKIAKDSGNKDLINWSLSNLADMYGHDGRITKSYKTYLEALSHNPADLHSLKGIAWIAFSHDKDTEEAKRIISFLKSIHPIPDYDLLLAEIATYEGDNQIAESYENDFLAKASRPEYGKMYQSYIGYLNENADEALKIAESEIENRPHPMSYNLLAWATLQKGEKQKAVDILEEYVIGQTEEPDALFYTGIILKEAGDTKQAKQFLKEALDASFELGPVAALEIESHLESL
jgi:tetratricopeptide (TPR) repeat protein